MYAAVENFETQQTESIRRVIEVSDTHDDLTQHQHDTHLDRRGPEASRRHHSVSAAAAVPPQRDVDEGSRGAHPEMTSHFARPRTTRSRCPSPPAPRHRDRRYRSPGA